MMKDREYRAKQESTRLAQMKHKETMERIAARAGMTVEQIRKLSMNQKDSVISFYRDGGPWEKKG